MLQGNLAVFAYDQRFSDMPSRHFKQRGIIDSLTMPTFQVLLRLFDLSRAFLPSSNMQGVIEVKHGVDIIHLLSHRLLYRQRNSASRATHNDERLPFPEQDGGHCVHWKYS